MAKTKKGRKTSGSNVVFNQTMPSDQFNRVTKYMKAKGLSSEQEAVRVLTKVALDAAGF